MVLKNRFRIVIKVTCFIKVEGLCYMEKTGDTENNVIIIEKEHKYSDAVEEESVYLISRFGKRGIDWTLEMQTFLTSLDKYYDRIDLKLSEETPVTIYFDITSFFITNG